MQTNNLVLLIGSNIGNRLQYLEQAQALIEQELGSLQVASAFYETAAWGKEDQQHFLNKVLLINTLYPPNECLTLILAIETKLGRVRLEKWAERVIDIDILFYNVERWETESLTIPHPYLHLRKFTLVPIAEILPDFIHPVLQKSMLELCEVCPDQLEVTIFKTY